MLMVSADAMMQIPRIPRGYGPSQEKPHAKRVLAAIFIAT